MNLVVMAGDDIGPEIIAAAMAVVKAADAEFTLGLRFTDIEVGMASHRRHGTTLTDSALQAAIDADGVIVGPCGMTDYPPLAEGGINIPGTIRKRLDLYANLRPARSRAGMPDARRDLDVLIVRENTEGFYSDRTMYQGIGEFMPTEDLALSVRKITRQGSRRIAKVAFDYAARRSKRITAVGKRHVLQMTDGLFMGEAYAEAKAHPDIVLKEMDMDAMAADIYSRPERHDVILITNMFGDILSNLAVALSGGLGLAAAINAGDKHAIAIAAVIKRIFVSTRSCAYQEQCCAAFRTLGFVGACFHALRCHNTGKTKESGNDMADNAILSGHRAYSPKNYC